MSESTNLALDQSLVADSQARRELEDPPVPQSGRIRLLALPADATGAGSGDRKRLAVVSIARRLREQGDLTAVERFSARHESETLPAQTRYYQSLLPQTAPRANEQYAFEVDLDRCTGCKACVTACHSLNGLDETETWRKVGLIQSETSAETQVITSSCHHCVEPACQQGCPVNAYEKDAITGIVRHLDDQCIGCQYCTLMCPYDAPQFSKSRGIVRKCDMCSQRLAVGEAPACVQACPNEAIQIRVIAREQASALAEREHFVPGAPSPSTTKPTTRYRSARRRATDAYAADRDTIRVEPAHWPLVVMLTLTQAGVGTLIVERILNLQLLAGSGNDLTFAATSLVWTAIALIASVFHLGRPMLAFRAVLNLRTSWLSREALAFGIFAQSILVYLVTSLPESILVRLGVSWLSEWHVVAGWVAACVGCVGVLCSVMVYVATRREHWRWSRTGTKFITSLLLQGAASCSVLLALSGVRTPANHALMSAALALVLVVGVAKLAWEAAIILNGKTVCSSAGDGPMVRIMLQRLPGMVHARFVLGCLGAVAFPLCALGLREVHAVASVAVVLSFAATIAGELLERALFFRAAPGSRMPGGL